MIRPLPLLFMIMVAAGCSGGGSSPSVSPSPAATDPAGSPTSAPAPTLSSTANPGRNCPVQNDICALADTFLVAFKTGDVEKVVSSARPQHLTCPEAGNESPELNSLRIACGSRSPGSEVDVYELQGKGPVFVQTLADYRALVVRAREGTYPDDVTIRAVGCGVKKGSTSGAPDCGTASVVMFQLRYIVGDEPFEVALVFSRPSVTMDWTIEKYWGLFPYASLPDTVPPGLRRGMGTIAGVGLVELYPYSLE